jgi:hypothetical protein
VRAGSSPRSGILGLDPRIGQSTHSAEIELPAAAKDARLKAGHDEFGDPGRAPNLNLTPIGSSPAMTSVFQNPNFSAMP